MANNSASFYGKADSIYHIAIVPDSPAADGSPRNKLIIAVKADPKNDITLLNWKNGDFGITLPNSPTAPDIVFVGDQQSNKNDWYYAYHQGSMNVSHDLKGLTGHDKFSGGLKNDLLDGEDGNDVLFGDAGHDTITGGTGDDMLSGGTGSDRIDADDGDDFVVPYMTSYEFLRYNIDPSSSTLNHDTLWQLAA